MDSKSEWGAPAVLVPKESGNGEFKPRFCINYQKLNKITKGNAYPIPCILSILKGMISYYYS